MVTEWGLTFCQSLLLFFWWDWLSFYLHWIHSFDVEKCENLLVIYVHINIWKALFQHPLSAIPIKELAMPILSSNVLWRVHSQNIISQFGSGIATSIWGLALNAFWKRALHIQTFMYRHTNASYQWLYRLVDIQMNSHRQIYLYMNRLIDI